MPDGVSGGTRIRTAAAAILEASAQCLRADPRVYVMGEGVADPKGIFGTTLGLIEEFGPSRIIEMPVAENGLTGIAIGSALMGQRPLMVHQRVDFALLALEQLFNNAAKTHFVTNGRHKVPLTVRMIIGRGWGQGPEHSQAMDAVFAHIPGLKVVMPATAYDAKGLLTAAIRDDNPVMILEHRWMHYATGHVPEEPYEVALSGQGHLRNGDDVTIVTSSFATLEALDACDAMRTEGVRADLFDLRVLRPLELSSIFQSVKRTGRVIIVDTGWKMFGVGAEVSAQIVEHCFSSLKAAPIRLGLPDYPTPSSRGLVGEYYPNGLNLVEAVMSLLPDRGDQLLGVGAAMSQIRSNVPIDVPHPAFRGPF